MEIVHQEFPDTPVRVVKDMPPDEQPREKLQRNGAETLSNAELLSILLRTGTSEMNVIDTSRAILNVCGGLHNMARKDHKDLCRVKGIGSVKAITIMAALELGKRLHSRPLEEAVFFRSPEDVYHFFGPIMRDYRKEVFITAYVNASKKMIGYERISVGGQTSTIVDASEVMKHAILNDAHSLILIHNHPSGNASASQADIQLTQRICKAGKIVGIRVEDHVIVAGYEYVSLRSKGLIEV